MSVRLQNIPLGTELVRDLLRHGAGKVYCPADYSGLEMRIVTELLRNKTHKV